MNRNFILAIGIVFLFITSTVIPILLKYNVRPSNNEIKIDCYFDKYYFPELYSSEKRIISVQSDNVISESSTFPIKTKKLLSEIDQSSGYTHTVFLEVATSQKCGPCHYMNKNLYNLYTSGDYNFEFVEMIIFDHKSQILNYLAWGWALSYYIWQFPTVIFDGDYRRLEGNHGSQLPVNLNDCGNRPVRDIIAGIEILWLGNAKMEIRISIQNNEEVQYNGFIRACITEIDSRYDTYQSDPYHFGFLDYAFKNSISIDPGEIYTSNIIWDGNEHMDNHGDDFGDIAKDNIRVILGVFNVDNNYVDATAASNPYGDNFPPNEPSNPSPPDGLDDIDTNADLSWICSDPDGEPITYDVYFGTSSSPPLISSNQNDTMYVLNQMDYDTKYYWKIIAFDNHGASTSSPIWSFNTKEKKKILLKLRFLKTSKSIYLNL